MIKVSLSSRFRNKDTKPPFSEDTYSHSFESDEVSVSDLINHILRGEAWAVGIYENNHRKKEHFIQSQILALDFDDNQSVGDCLSNQDIARYAALIHTTPSGGAKSRVVFVMDRPIADNEKWELAAQAMLHHFRDMKPDAKCKDCARFFYGSDVNAENAAKYPDKRIPLETIARWVAEYNLYLEEKTANEDEQLALAPSSQADYSYDKRRNHADRVYHKVIDDLIMAKEGERNDRLNKAAYFLFGCARGAWPGIDTVRVRIDLERTGRELGLSGNEVKATLKSAENAAAPIAQNIQTSAPDLSTFVPDSKEDVAAFQAQTIGHLSQTLRSLSVAAKDDTIQTDQLQTMAEHAYNAVGQIMLTAGHTQSVSAVSAAREVSKLIAERMDNPQLVIGLESRITALDYGIGGFEDGKSYTFIGDTGTGKTAMAATLALVFAEQAPGIVITCENNEIEFQLRMVAHKSRIPFSCLSRGGMIEEVIGESGGFRRFTMGERYAIKEAQGTVLQSVSGTHLYSSPSPTPTAIRSLCRQHRQTLRWIIIDSLNNLTLPYQASDYERVTAAALLCEELAITYNIPVISTCQGGRNTKGRASKELGLHDAKGSGAVEEKASGIITIYNHWYHVKQGDKQEGTDDESIYPKGTVRMSVRKLRGGITGSKFNVEYLGGCGMYNYKVKPRVPTRHYVD